MTQAVRESVQVLRSLGGQGWACRISSEQITDSWVEEVQASGWVPLDVVLDSNSTGESSIGQDDKRVRSMAADTVNILTQRFPPGRPLHLLIAHDIDSDLLRTIATRFLPWVIGTDRNGDLGEIPGYSPVVSVQLGWWLRSDLQHLTPGLTGLTGIEPIPVERTLATRVKGRLRPHIVRLAYTLPGPVKGRLVRRRHLEAVRANEVHLTHPAYLGAPPADVVAWLTPHDLPDVPRAATTIAPLDDSLVEATKLWLSSPHDSDAMLDRRMDNHGDELGRTRAALATRIALKTAARSEPCTLNDLLPGPIVVDARCLQSPAFGTRGIGRFALSVVAAVRTAVGDENVVLLIDPTLEPLTASIAGDCASVRSLTSDTVRAIGALIQPSPMTASPDPLLPALVAGVPSLAVVYDFIPAHYPTVYLSHPAARSEYGAQLDALALYGEYLAISHTTAGELAAFLRDRDRHDFVCEVAWPQAVSLNEPVVSGSDRSGPIVVMTGDEPRKNTFGALAAVGVATAGEKPPREVVVVGMAGQATRVHHLSIAAAMRPGEARVLDRIGDAELSQILKDASVVVVASFDEGLSLPVIEALQNGAPVIASDIPAHRELLGDSDGLAPVRDVKALSEAIRIHRGDKALHRRQSKRLMDHEHSSIEEAVGSRLRGTERRIRSELMERTHSSGRRRVAVATPWPPQETGVADFSLATVTALRDYADVTVFTTSDASFGEPVDELSARTHEFDVLIAVAGNSHYHLSILEALRHIRETSNLPTIVIAHDTRMVEYYMALRSKGGAEAMMLRGQVDRELSPTLDEQINDMRLLQNAGFWEVAHLADRLILHSIGAAGRIAKETGVTPVLLPFANQRVPDHGTLTPEMRREARCRLDIPDDVLFLASFGYADNRTKLTDVVVEAAAWLTQWGRTVSLHHVGAATPELQRSLAKRAQQAGIHDFRITGYASEDLFRDYLLGIDFGVQLRVSPLLGVSGPLSDMSAFGCRGVASGGLAIDVDAPDFIYRLPDDISPLLVAEAIERLESTPDDPLEREEKRIAYLATKTPQKYAEHIAGLIDELLS